MSSTGSVMEKIETNKVKLTITFSPEEFRTGLLYAYNKAKGQINIQGFRKGKAPRKIIEQYYGKDVFYEEAINHLLPEAYEAALDEHELEPVYKPEVDVTSMDEKDGAVCTAEVFVKPEVEIEGYVGLTYPIIETEPTDDDIEKRLQDELEKNSRLITVDRAAEMGDTVSINFTGYIDGEPFEGGEATDYDLHLGSKSLIDTFEDQLVGHVAGDEVDVNVTFPDDYGKTDLQGKPALFKVELLEVQGREMPELDDDFAQDVSEFDTLEEFREDLISKIREEKENRANVEKRASVVAQLVEKAVMEVPEAMYTARIEEMTEEMRYRLWTQGLGLEQYLSFSRMTMADLHDNYQAPAKEEVEARLVLEAVAKKEDFAISDEELHEYIGKIAMPNQSVDDILEEMNEHRKKALIQDLKNQKALDYVVEKAVAIEVVDKENKEEE